MPGLPFSGWELLLILGIALIVLGPGKLPDLGAAMGRTIREFRKAASDVQEAANLDPKEPPAPSSTSREPESRRADPEPASGAVTAPATEREPDPALPPSVESRPGESRDPAAPVEPRGLSTPPAPPADEIGQTAQPGGRGHVAG
jgi:TatA/E family protein of Tat protein translocase